MPGATQRRSPLSSAHEGSDRRASQGIDLREVYLKDICRVVERRLLQAGYRLGADPSVVGPRTLNQHTGQLCF